MNDERFKGAIHALTGGLALTLTLYNAMKLCEPTCAPSPVGQEAHQGRHKANVIVYGALWLFETRQTWLHWSKCAKD